MTGKAWVSAPGTAWLGLARPGSSAAAGWEYGSDPAAHDLSRSVLGRSPLETARKSSVFAPGFHPDPCPAACSPPVGARRSSGRLVVGGAAAGPTVGGAAAGPTVGGAAAGVVGGAAAGGVATGREPGGRSASSGPNADGLASGARAAGVLAADGGPSTAARSAGAAPRAFMASGVPSPVRDLPEALCGSVAPGEPPVLAGSRSEEHT